jgi:hypothetical protein
MKKILFFLTLIFTSLFSYSQNVGIGTNVPHGSAALEIQDTSRGILIPRMTMVQRNAIQNPAEGLMVYQTDSTKGFWYWDGLEWRNFSTINTNSSTNSVSSKYFFKLNGWSSGNCNQCYVSSIVYWDFNNYSNPFSSDSNVTFNNTSGEITFMQDGIYQIKIDAIVGGQTYGAYLSYFSNITNTWHINNNSIITIANYTSYMSGNLYTDVQCLNIKQGDKIKFSLAPRGGNQGYNIYVQSGAIIIDKLD